MGLAALANTDTAKGCAGHPALSRELKERPYRLGLIGRPPQALGGAISFDQLPWIHQAVRVPNALELPERADQRFAEHLRQQFRSRLSVAVLAREGSAVRHDQVGRFVDERPVGRNTSRRFKVEVRAGVYATLAEMAVQRATIAKAVQ